MDIDLTFSDGSVVNLRDVNPNNYFLNVKSLNPDIIAFAPTEGARYPRVIAISSGSGPLLSVSLEIQDGCDAFGQRITLISSKADVDVKLTNQDPNLRRDRFQTNELAHHASSSIDMGDLGDALSNIALRDDQNYFKPALSSQRHYPSGSVDPRLHQQHSMANLELATTILMGVFLIAISVFVLACLVMVTKYRRQKYPLQKKSQSVQNAHDWVWLGKSTMDKSSVRSSGSRDTLEEDHRPLPLTMDAPLSSETSPNALRRQQHQQNSQGAIEKRKSQRLSYVGSEINIIPNPQTEEYEAEVSNPNSPGESPTEMPPPVMPKQQHVDLCSELPRRGRLRGGVSQPPRNHVLTRLPPGHPMLQNEKQQHYHPSDYRQGIPPQGGVCVEPAVITRAPPAYNKQQRPNNLRTGSSSSSQQDQYLPSSPNSSATYTNSNGGKSRPLPPKLSPPINTATYTKRDLYSPPREGQGIIPVGYPLFSSTNSMTGSAIMSQSSLDALAHIDDTGAEEEEEEEPAVIGSGYRHPSMLSPLDLPDPSTLELLSPSSPIRQSPASALPPMAENEEEPTERAPLAQEYIDDPCENEGGADYEDDEDYMPVNPDIDRPSPPRHGAPRLFENPFDLTDEDSVPVQPEKLSPNHVFETSNLEEMLLKDGPVVEGEKVLSPRVNTATFVRQKSYSPVKYQPGSSNGSSGGGSPFAVPENNEEETSLGMGMDYEQLMSYFESLKESNA